MFEFLVASHYLKGLEGLRGMVLWKKGFEACCCILRSFKSRRLSPSPLSTCALDVALGYCTLICVHADMFPATMVVDWSSETVSMLPTECFLRLSLAIVCLHNNKVILVLSENLLDTLYSFITNFQGTQSIRLCSWRSEWPEYWQADPPKEKAHPPYEGKTIRCTYWVLSFHHTVPRVPLSSLDLWPWAQGIGDVYTASFSWLLGTQGIAQAHGPCPKQECVHSSCPKHTQGKGGWLPRLRTNTWKSSWLVNGMTKVVVRRK